MTDDAYDFVRLGAVIAERIEEQGMSQVELARRTGLHRVTIGRIVKGQLKSPPSPVTAQALERALGWLPGSVEAVLRGGMPAEGSYDGKYLRVRIDNETEFVRDLVRKITFEVDADAPLSRIVAAEAIAEAALREAGLLPPLDDQAIDESSNK